MNNTVSKSKIFNTAALGTVSTLGAIASLGVFAHGAFNENIPALFTGLALYAGSVVGMRQTVRMLDTIIAQSTLVLVHENGREETITRAELDARLLGNADGKNNRPRHPAP